MTFDRRVGSEQDDPGVPAPGSGDVASTAPFDGESETTLRIASQAQAPTGKGDDGSASASASANNSFSSVTAQQEKTLRNMMGGYR